MNTNKQLNKGNTMKKTLLSLLIVISVGTAIATPSNAGWSNGPAGLFYCNNNGGCTKY
jgi:hypothetical protein